MIEPKLINQGLKTDLVILGMLADLPEANWTIVDRVHTCPTVKTMGLTMIGMNMYKSNNTYVIGMNMYKSNNTYVIGTLYSPKRLLRLDWAFFD